MILILARIIFREDAFDKGTLPTLFLKEQYV